ncbi:hypothetical protein SUGI_0273220 [Cryptomeria japonica]|uniref:protein root UVB sensitive 6 n=1 Tax=Cryptomeria japonica TaxID=3369 RepID=UPI002408AE9E|nr:protein root UVB sensitive 6 [Cryptomeria japonica]GLJ16250.1 hypothetical protein SUGI_0273220 [Cryptomeria japonica]
MAPLLEGPPPPPCPSKILMRESIRLSANLASPLKVRRGQGQGDDERERVLCCEVWGGKRYKYVGMGKGKGMAIGVAQAVPLHSSHNPFEDLITFIRSWVVPDGYPESVTSSYAPYMQWRALKYFFGGAMSVFTTRSLLHSVGIVGKGSASSAVAVNWVLKDGAGRIGKMLFARLGKKFDSDLKQLRFTSDLFMEFGAGIELATAAAPHLFLPFACAANVAKNIAAVTSTSTRSHIYRAFAQGENIGDVTAKGECISNIADLLGTGLSVYISKQNPSLLATFAVLSCGYIFCSYREVKSVVLNSLNNTRFAAAVESFLETGRVPSVKEGNMKENFFPWSQKQPVIIGARLIEAFQKPNDFLSVQPLFEKEKYIVTYNPLKGQAYALLREKSSSDDVMRAAFHAHLLLHVMQTSKKVEATRNPINYAKVDIFDSHTAYSTLSAADIQAEIADTCGRVSSLYSVFKNQAAQQGWRMSESLLNSGNARVLKIEEDEM